LESANQPSLYEDLHLFFEDPEAARSSWQVGRTCEKGHGRLEIRHLTTSTDLNEYFETRWAGIQQVFRLERIVKEKGQTRREVVYGLTSLSPQQADADRLLVLIRAHWRIENRLHWRRDVTLGEDRCQVRTGQAPQVLAALNNAVLGLMDFLRVTNVAAQMRIFDARPLEAVRLLLAAPAC
jgi:predicted transposase YbfD/YdcC